MSKKIQKINFFIFAVVALLIIIFGVLLSLRSKSKRSHKKEKPGIVFTCTTFFDFEKQNKWECFITAMDSIIKFHDRSVLDQIDTWIVVNEFAENPKKDWEALVKEKYPFVTFVTKNSDQKGQAASMNIILELIKPYKYWIHWEETWFCRRECLGRMIDVVKSTDVDQLQATQLNDKPSWADIDPSRLRESKTPNGVDYIYVLPNPNVEEYKLDKPLDDPQFMGDWPLYSLLPSINKVAPYDYIGTFNEDVKYWPFNFELDFAKRWFKQGCKKGILPDGPIIRDNKKHVSTYN